MRGRLVRKFWTAYWVLGVTTVITGMTTDSFLLTLGVAIVAASCGWTAFLMGD